LLTSKALLAFSVPGLHATEAPKLKIWHGLTSPAFLISMSILAVGTILYLMLERTRWRWEGIPIWLRADAAFTKGIDNLPAFGGWITRLLGVEHPKFHAPVILAVGLLWVGLPLIGQWSHLSLPAFDGDSLFIAALAAILLVCAGMCILFAPSWRAQVILMGTIGFLVTFYFVLYRAPDLALTQILVEAATLILLLVIILRFPQLQHRPCKLSALTKSVNAVIALGIGVLMTVLTLVLTSTRAARPLGDDYLAASLPKAKGSNAVNTILVDFRGFDTLLEIGVLVIATLGIIGLLLRRKEGSRHAG
jgi:multisubunit Na+/H+ antiporter MnhB subunit